MPTATDVISFWFSEISPAQWWQTPQGRLAEIIVLDQFSRNIYRDTPKAFTQDALALGLAQYAVQHNDLAALPEEQRPFLIMPYMHSESAIIHQHAIALFRQYAPANLDFELKHKVIIDQFGRYPHRNQILGRASTSAEKAFLTQADSSF